MSILKKRIGILLVTILVLSQFVAIPVAKAAGDTTPPTTTITLPASNAYVNGTIAVTGTASDTNMSSWTLDYGTGSSPSSWTTINTGTTSVTNGTLGSWNTSSLTNGSVYTLRLKATDSSSNSNSITIQITKDSTLPTADIFSPDNNSYINGNVTITGTASDTHISNWILDYGLGTSPSSWTTINSGTASITSGTLGTWNTSSLTDGSLYKIRLRVTDLAGNTSQITKNLTKDATYPIATLTRPVSNSTIGGSYTVTGTASDSNISSWVLDFGSGSSPSSWTTIDDGTSSIINGTISTWYMSSLSDGSVYTIRLRVTDAAGNLSQATRIITKSSNVLPTTDMWAPDSGSTITGVVDVTGTVSDTDLSSWILEYGLGADPSSWTTINSGTTPIVGGTLGSWDTSDLIADSQYKLRLKATDAAGNYNQTTKLITVGSTIPVTTIIAPADNARIGGTYTVKGTVSSTNMDNWTLEYGTGTSPTSWIEINNGYTSVNNGPLGTWYMSSLTDGSTYTLKLTATDSSGKSNQAIVHVIKDSTVGPVTDMAAPDNNSFISGIVTVTGTASDTDLTSWTLDYGSGTSPLNWTSITTGTNSIINGTIASWNTSSLTDDVYTLRLSATDAGGNYSQTTKHLTKDITMPVTTITSPVNNSNVNGIVTVIGTVSDANMSSWTLEYGVGASPSSWTTINTGTALVSNATLGYWNTNTLTNGSIYLLRLRAIDATGNSNQTTVQIIENGTVLPVTSIALPANNAHICGTYTVKGTVSDANISSWELDYGVGTSPTSWTEINSGTTSLINEALGTWYMSSFSDGTVYTLKLTATNAAGNSNQATLQITKDSTVAPIADMFSPDNNSSISGTVTITGSVSDTDLSGWTLDYGLGTSPSSWTVITTGTNSISSGTIGSWDTTSLTEGSTYRLRLRSTDVAGNTSQITKILTKASGADNSLPSQPTNVTCSSQTESAVILTWTASNDNVGVTGYDIYRDGSQVGSTTNTTYTDNNLSIGNTYVYVVIARDAAGNISEASTPLNAIIKDLTPPSTPTNVTCNAKTETTATLLWTPSTDNIGVSGYSIYRDGTEVGSAADTTYIDKGLTAGKTYAYTVKAVDNAGNVSGASASISVTEADITSPSTPTGLTCSSKTDTTVTLGWAASTDNVGVTEYDIYRDGTEVGSTPNTAYTDMWLISGQTYSYTVKAKDAVGNVSKESNSVSVIADSTPPSAPTNLKCTSNTNNTNIVTLTWTASTDNVTVVSYDIYRNGNKVGNTASLTYTDTGLSVNAYTYTVMAKDSAGNISLPSSQLKVTLTDTTPPTMSWVTPANKEVYKNSVLTLTASGVSDPAGVSSVVFTVYNQADGSSKNVTYSGINIGNGTWIATFDSTKHTTKTGTFIVTVTGKDNRLNSGNMGNSQFTVTGFQQGGSSITQPYDPGASIGQVNIGSSNGAITITANNVKASSSVSNVKINVHGINGQTGQVIYNQTLSMTNQGNYNWTSNFSISSVMGSYKGSIGIDLIVYGTDGSQNDYGEYNITI